jgi:DNA-binding beta-propeller fold protein YncE
VVGQNQNPKTLTARWDKQAMFWWAAGRSLDSGRKCLCEIRSSGSRRPTNNSRNLVPPYSFLCPLFASVVFASAALGTQPVYRSPLHIAVSPDGSRLFVSDATADNVTVLSTTGEAAPVYIDLKGSPRGLALTADGKTLFVCERGAGTVAAVDTQSLKVLYRLSAGRWPTAVAFAEQSKRLFVCNEDRHDLMAFELLQDSQPAVVRLVREPSAIALAPDEKHVVVTNRLPAGAGTDPDLAAVVSIVETDQLTVTANIQLPAGSTNVNGVVIDPEGRWAYVVHQLGRHHLPITQIERGWVNTHALSIIDIAAGRRFATVLLDELTRGAANPFDVVVAKDARWLFVSHAGVHRISRLDLRQLHRLLDGNATADIRRVTDSVGRNVWAQIADDPKNIEKLTNDLTALYIGNVISRFSSAGQGPHGLAISPEQGTLFVANRFSGEVAALDPDNKTVGQRLSLGPQPEPNAQRRGAALFHDAGICFQQWQSCASCHPNDGRIDGLRWDFIRDGIGNPTDTISLVDFHKTPPYNRRATRHDARECVRTGVIGSHRLIPDPQAVDDMLAYLKGIRPEPSPHLLPGGDLSPSALRGKKLFHGEANCVGCHSGPLATDLKPHDVGTGGRLDTPSLIEAYRTSPYLHDGRAATLFDVFSRHDPDGKHGAATSLSEGELRDLIEYLLSL